jgi:hypothetical protein
VGKRVVLQFSTPLHILVLAYLLLITYIVMSYSFYGIETVSLSEIGSFACELFLFSMPLKLNY